MEPRILLKDSNLEQWMKESGISPRIRRKPLITISDNAKTVLLTGCTGYLGKFILHELLQTVEYGRIFCHIRPSANPRERLWSILKSSFTGNMETLKSWFTKKVRIVEGDLSKPLLGLNMSEFSYLATVVDVVIHNGAHVNHIKSYDDLKQENVESTKAILRLVMNGRPKFLNFVSTINVLYCCKNDGSLDETMFSTAESVGNWYKYGSGYNCTKWVSEQLIIQAIDRGFVNGAISRPGPIGPHSETGEANDGDWLHYLFSAMLELGVYPRSTLQGTPKLFLAPVDYVAKGVAAVSLRGNTAKDLLPGAKYAVYHYWYSHQPLRQDDFAAALLAIKPLKTIDFGEFKLILAEQSKKGSISVSRIGKIISFFPTEESFSLIKHVDKAYFNLSDDHTRSVLKNNYGIAAPPYDEQAISSYSRWMAKTVERSLQSRL